MARETSLNIASIGLCSSHRIRRVHRPHGRLCDHFRHLAALPGTRERCRCGPPVNGHQAADVAWFYFSDVGSGYDTSDSLTWKWKMVPWKTTFLYGQEVFHFHVSELECNTFKCNDGNDLIPFGSLVLYFRRTGRLRQTPKRY